MCGLERHQNEDDGSHAHSQEGHCQHGVAHSYFTIYRIYFFYKTEGREGKMRYLQERTRQSV